MSTVNLNWEQHGKLQEPRGRTANAAGGVREDFQKEWCTEAMKTGKPAEGRGPGSEGVPIRRHRKCINPGIRESINPFHKY